MVTSQGVPEDMAQALDILSKHEIAAVVLVTYNWGKPGAGERIAFEVTGKRRCWRIDPADRSIFAGDRFHAARWLGPRDLKPSSKERIHGPFEVVPASRLAAEAAREEAARAEQVQFAEVQPSAGPPVWVVEADGKVLTVCSTFETVLAWFRFDRRYGPAVAAHLEHGLDLTRAVALAAHDLCAGGCRTYAVPLDGPLDLYAPPQDQAVDFCEAGRALRTSSAMRQAVGNLLPPR